MSGTYRRCVERLISSCLASYYGREEVHARPPAGKPFIRSLQRTDVQRHEVIRKTRPTIPVGQESACLGALATAPASPDVADQVVLATVESWEAKQPLFFEVNNGSSTPLRLPKDKVERFWSPPA